MRPPHIPTVVARIFKRLYSSIVVPVASLVVLSFLADMAPCIPDDPP